MSDLISCPRGRYVWLDRMYTFGDSFSYAVHDEVAGQSYGVLSGGVRELEVYGKSIDGGNILELIQAVMVKHELSRCTVFDKNSEQVCECFIKSSGGYTIDRIADIRDMNRMNLYCSDVEKVKEAKYLSLDDRWNIEKVVVYELM